jgi:hypothetical protein
MGERVARDLQRFLLRIVPAPVPDAILKPPRCSPKLVREHVLDGHDKLADNLR